MTKCAECGSANPDGNRHCGQCGAPLPAVGVSVAHVRKLIDEAIAKKPPAETDALEARVFEGARKKLVDYVKWVGLPLTVIASIAAGIGINKFYDLFTFTITLKKELEQSQAELHNSFNALESALLQYNIIIVTPATRKLLSDYIRSYLGYIKDSDQNLNDLLKAWVIEVTDHPSYAQNEMVAPWQMKWKISVAAGAIGQPALALVSITSVIMQPPRLDSSPEPKPTDFEPSMLRLGKAIPIYVVCAFRDEPIELTKVTSGLTCTAMKLQGGTSSEPKMQSAADGPPLAPAIDAPPLATPPDYTEFLDLFSDIEKLPNMGRRRTAVLLLRTWFAMQKQPINQTTVKAFFAEMPKELNKMGQLEASPPMKDVIQTLEKLLLKVQRML